MSANVSPCRACGSSVEWVPTASGRVMPLDLVPIIGGNVEIRDGVAAIVKPDATSRRVSHFAICPAADQFRRRRPAGAAP